MVRKTLSGASGVTSKPCSAAVLLYFPTIQSRESIWMVGRSIARAPRRRRTIAELLEEPLGLLEPRLLGFTLTSLQTCQKSIRSTGQSGHPCGTAALQAGPTSLYNRSPTPAWPDVPIANWRLTHCASAIPKDYCMRFILMTSVYDVKKPQYSPRQLRGTFMSKVMCC